MYITVVIQYCIMEHIQTTLVIFYLCFSHIICFINECNTAHLRTCEDASKKPLILTPLIKQGKIKEARAAAEVKFSEFKNTKSYSAYFTVNGQYNSNLFFWFFPSRGDYTNAPVILWLEGGPGGSSLGDVFFGNGPFEITSDLEIELGKYAWIQNQSIIYIDNPAGVGYSYTDEGGYAQNQTIIGAQLYEALLQFFQLFPELQENNFFVAGISYAGKYVPAVSYAIHKNNPMATKKINLKGLVIGNGLSDPEHQLKYSTYLHQVGLLDSNGQQKMKEMEKDYVSYIKKEEWQKAYKKFNQFVFDKNSFYQTITGLEDIHDYLSENLNDGTQIVKNIEKYMQLENVKTALHVGNTTYYSQSNKVFQILADDIPKSVALWISELLRHYKILFYNGQLDVICAYPLTVNFIKNLNFSGADAYKTAPRLKWYVGTDLAGYVKDAGNLTEILVRNASHAVQLDQPQWLLDLITRFAHGTPFY